MVLADPDLVVPEVVEPLDQLHVAADGERRVLADAVERREEYPVLHSAVGHGLSVNRVVRRMLTGERHLGHDQPKIGAWLERDPLAHAVDDDLLEQLDRGLLVLEDGGRLSIECLALFLVEGVARLLHELVEALTGLAPRPVLAVETRRMKD